MLASATVLVLLLGFTLAVSYGSTAVPFGQVWSTVRDGMSGRVFQAGSIDVIVWQVRVPRPILAMIVGAGLGVVGVAVQALVRNDLADPYLLGVSSGASVGAVWVLVFGGGVVGAVSTAIGVHTVLPMAAFLGAMVALGAVWSVTGVAGGISGALGPTRLVLVGVTVGQILSAGTSFMVLQTDDQAQTRSVLFWLMGSLGGATWSQIPITALVVVLGSIVLYGRARQLNALAFGDESASALGISVHRVRREVFVVVSLMTGAVVAVSGAIGFIGLLVPHLCRLVVGTDHRKLLPTAVLVGATLMIFVDLVCRVATRVVHQELPVNVVTAALGGPMLLAMLIVRGRRA
ncbi:iron ABC transporter permease [Rhodococcus sp. IEGM 1354]|uniref:FecCD family ABC transporter permease n=1 Tax=Rhodococcus sp. IEGM 1354 TaxID=3047088 RepID=UPI0024B68D94|nr:iron ABC transporter permease [Rhodococcus sp. IEGM 1354]MDI9929708.1 iron ABC transporter permease [Rhodococcus sp. IEGM 1354]